MTISVNATTPMLLLPGFLCTPLLWQFHMRALSDVVSCQAVSFDGRKPTIPEIAAAILLRAPLRFVLAGISMGGMVACEIVRQAPQRVMGLALISTAAQTPDSEQPHTLINMANMAISHGIPAVLHQSLRGYYLDRPLSCQRSRMSIRNLRRIHHGLLTMACRSGLSAMIGQAKALRADHLRWYETLSRFTAPTLVMYGTNDGIFPKPYPCRIQEAVAGPCQTISLMGVGHMSVLEAPDLTALYLKRWLQGFVHTLPRAAGQC